MSIWLRVILIFVSLCSTIYVIRKIRKSQMKIEEAMYWMFFVVLILMLSIIPSICYLLADWIGVESPVNLVYLVIIFICLGKVFSLSVRLSQLEYKISILTEEMAIWRKKIEDEKKGSTNDQ